MSIDITKLKTRSQQKRAVEADWNKATNFIPLQGEIIVYEIDEEHSSPRIKIGEGIVQPDGTVKGRSVIDLPFLDTSLTWNIFA